MSGKRRAIPAVIREQLEALAHERDQAVAQEAITREAYEDLQKIHNKTGEAVSELRKQLDDMRRQRNEAVDDAQDARRELHCTRLKLERALGWVDCKSGSLPDLGAIPDGHDAAHDISRILGRR